MHSRFRFALIFTFVALVSALPLLTLLGDASPGLAQDDEPVGMPMSNDRLVAPPMPANPTQADEGAHVYWLSCMACHGDVGQGLTDEWRSAWAEGDQNCWQSKCHAANHPVEGFVLPHTIPPVIGKDILNKYATANDLFAFIKARMPWHIPGSLPDEEYWQLTSYLVRANGFGDVSLSPTNAATVKLAAPAAQPEPESAAVQALPGKLGIAIILVLVAGIIVVGILFIGRERAKRSNA